MVELRGGFFQTRAGGRADVDVIWPESTEGKKLRPRNGTSTKLTSTTT
jgi:hypothetical protein